MTTISPTDRAPGVPAPVHDRPPLALRLRRWTLIGMLPAAGALGIVGAVADPAAGMSGDEMYVLYTDGMAALQLKSLGFHYAYALWLAPALLLARTVVGRGRALANVAAVLAFLSITTLPGMLMVDWIQSAIGQLHGPEAIDDVFALVEQQAWGFPVLQVPAMLGLMLALPIAMIAQWRARRVSWWSPLAAVGAIVAFTVSLVTWPGAVVTAACLTVVAISLVRPTRDDV